MELDAPWLEEDPWDPEGPNLKWITVISLHQAGLWLLKYRARYLVFPEGLDAECPPLYPALGPLVYPPLLGPAGLEPPCPPLLCPRPPLPPAGLDEPEPGYAGLEP